MRTFPCGILAAILLLGCSLRFLHYKSPFGQSDEAITVEVVRYLRQSGDWDVNWKHADLSADLRYDQYNFSSHLYATYFFYRFVKLLPGTLEWRSEGEGFAVYRFFVAALASLAVFQTLHLGRKLGGWPAAIAAGLLSAVAPLLVQDAHYIRPEPFTTVLVLGAVALSLPGGRELGWRPMGAGVCVGLLVACKISMVVLAWLPFVPIVAHWRQHSRNWTIAAGAFVAMAGGFVVGAPGVLTNPPAFAHGVRRLMVQYAGLHPPHSHVEGSAVADMMGRYFAATLGWPTLACFLLGWWALARQRAHGQIAAVVGPAILFFGYFATRSVFFERNLSHVVPLVFVVAGVGVGAIFRWWSQRSRVAALIGTSAVCVLFALRPATIACRLVGRELSGKAAGDHDRFESALRARHPNLAWTDQTLLTDEPLRSFAAHFQNGGGGLLLKVPDYRDEWTALNLGHLRRRFQVDALAEHPGTFPELPTCTLLTYHSPPYLYLRVRGIQSQ